MAAEFDLTTMEGNSTLGETISVGTEPYSATGKVALVIGESDSMVVKVNWVSGSLIRRQRSLLMSGQANLAWVEEPIYLACAGKDFLA